MPRQFRTVKNMPDEVTRAEVARVSTEVAKAYPSLRPDVIEILQTERSNQYVFEVLGDMMLHGATIVDYLENVAKPDTL